MSRPKIPTLGRRTARAAGATVVVAALTAGCSMNLEDYTLPGGADVGEDPMNVAVQFDDVLDLVLQSSVKVNGLDAGRVAGISLADDGWTAQVDIVLRDDLELPANVEASIQQTNLLGEKFVQLTPPGDEPPTGRLSDGDVVRTSNTRTATDIEQVLGALSLLLNGGGVDQLQPIVAEMRTLTDGREEGLTSTLRSADELISGLNRQRDSITAALEGVNLMTARANDQRQQIQAALDELPAGVAVLEEQRPQFVEMLRRVDALGEVGSDILLTSREDLIADLRALRPVLQYLSESTPELIELAGFVPTFPFPDTSIPATVGGAANLFLSVDASISETLRGLGANQGDPVVPYPNTTSGPYVVDPQNPWVGDNGPDRRTTIVLPLLPVPPVMDRAVVPKPAPGTSEFSENYLPEPGEPGYR
ncbi:MCE family protein [Dietzia sp. PP-33]|uniref:MCE family protein n=1 Tax=Dietzia sp. PP-33 TaxID=2957500 RepID=UPI0029B2D636|nr:MCE family protein [Dietzia sp. PP-33]MDX2358191.1 MCE family protein [Dietzia sp. PP-33]